MNPEYWSKAKAFHGHECPGLAIGVKACQAVVEKMGVSPAFDEELICIAENDACGVDAVQALMGCTLGKGNLEPVDTKLTARIFGDFDAFLRCRQSEYIKYSFLLRLEMHQNRSKIRAFH